MDTFLCIGNSTNINANADNYILKLNKMKKNKIFWLKTAIILKFIDYNQLQIMLLP